MSMIRLFSVAMIAGALAPAAAAGWASAAVSGSGNASIASVVGAPPAGVRLEVSLSQRELRVMRDGEVMRTYRVAIGQAEYPTPRGSFAIGRVVWNPRWVPPKAEWAKGKSVTEPGDPDNPMGKAKLFFREPDYYIHGTEAEESLGQAASHGCLRMANSDVVELAKLVMENGGENRPPSWFKRILNYVRSTQEVRLANPVSLTIYD